MWIELVSSLSGDVDFSTPVDEGEFVAVESALGQTLPADLKSFLRESDGVSDEFGCDFVWSAAEILARNREMNEREDFRNLYMPFDSLLFIGDSGGGDLFAFVVKPLRLDIFVWEHETDSRRWVARDLEDYIRRYLSAGGEDWYAS
ncbi:SMI1/KNR4 family protein [Streptomyces cathayae]|uniref:SMI1/KNR4 family protein n=1 Tax=Streptomyces cathayae TaxID=3031124 RepID=A0ABY8K4B4_9ACTN|nr:SMI1/KNR4 family protein [Streptomyces sp. HUAS 5]WGD42946.1 SMI1/KNR4 family protein [Streptomyces sp. HUAS 5]